MSTTHERLSGTLTLPKPHAILTHLNPRTVKARRFTFIVMTKREALLAYVVSQFTLINTTGERK